jgi:hypothetical protein
MKPEPLNATGKVLWAESTLRYLVVGMLLCISCCAPAWGRTVTNEELDFRLSVPNRYIQLPSSGDTIFTFATSDPTSGVPEATVVVQRLHGTIGTDHMDLAATGIPDAHLLSGRWKTFDIDILAGHLSQNGLAFSVRGAQIPLQHEAIQVIVLVPIKLEARADSDLQEFLAGLDGPSNWSTQEYISPQESGRLLGEGIARLAVTIALLAAGTIAIVRYFRRRKDGRRNQKMG